jgi:hypothetical protein
MVTIVSNISDKANLFAIGYNTIERIEYVRFSSETKAA